MEFLPWEAIKSSRASSQRILVNDRPFAEAASEAAASNLAALIRRLRRSAPQGRQKILLRALRRHVSTSWARRRFSLYSKRTATLFLFSNLLFLLLVLAAAWVLRFGSLSGWPWWLAALLGLMFAISWLFFRSHRWLYPAARWERLQHTLVMLLSAPAAIRARDLLARHLLECVHPLAAALALPFSICGLQFATGQAQTKNLEVLARAQLLHLRHPLPHEPLSEGAARTSHWYRQALEEGLCRQLRQAGLDPGDLLKPPQPESREAQAYCPRCRSQFSSVESLCADCLGMEVVAFD